MTARALRLSHRAATQVGQLALAGTALIAVPVLMAWAWIAFFANYFNMHVIPYQQLLALSGIAAVYSLDRLLDPDPRLRVLYQQGLRLLLRCVFLMSMLVAITVLFLLDWAPWQMVLCCCALSVANWLGKKVFLGKNVFVTAAWLCSCALLPFAPYAWKMHDYIMLGPWFIIFMIACILCDIKDIEHDRSCAVRSLPVCVGTLPTLRVLKWLCLIAFALSCVAGSLHLIVLALCLYCCTHGARLMHDSLLAPLLVDGILFMCAVSVLVV